MSDDITVEIIEENTVVEVIEVPGSPVVEVVERGFQGIQGEQGIQGPPGALVREVPAGDIDDLNTVFGLSQAAQTDSLQVFLNGLLQSPPDDYVAQDVETIVFTEPPLVGDSITVVYSPQEV